MIDILGRSQMGAAEYVAEQVAETLVQAGYDVKLHLKPFDPSMSALPIIVKQNSPSVGLFTH